ncbi:PucR family transcriptional regulator [Streptomyces sp. NBC_01408]|uniref:PucR family transcriptional regulator n=1 Tax=Streptomyces sp. NBC_01408 TaxID=2903855 RepID=UPI002253528B|nr:PucR family transcriptional regulator [Streptomyces sp. NBC_01408]MCX4693252.1 PucR family transcriptional regulator [Streptomyces sp. NBC_01408]
MEAPPTPPVPLGALLRDRELGLAHLAGPAGAEVHAVHASEMADPSPYLLGGELLLTAGTAPGDAEAYVARLAGAGVAALGFGVAPVHERVPPGLAEACDRYGLPLLEVPPGTPFTAVARTVWRLMAEARTRELRRVTEAQQSLAAAAARPDPVQSVLSRLATTLGGWTALLAPTTTQATPRSQSVGRGHAGGSPQDERATQPPPTQPDPSARAEETLRRGTTPPAPATQATPRSQAVGWGHAGGSPQDERATQPPPTQPDPSARAEETLRRGTAPPNAPAAPGAPADPATPPAPLAAAGPEPAADVLAAVAALARRVAPGTVTTATDTLGGTHLAAYAVGGGHALALATPARAPGDHTIASVAAVLLTLLTAHRPARTEAAALTRLLLDRDPAAALPPGPWHVVLAHGSGDPQALAAALGTVLLDPYGDSVRLLTDREPGPQPGWRLGVSGPAAPGELPTAATQARRALHRAEAARTPLVRHTDGGLGALLDPAEARAHAGALLAPLGPALRETLRAWLAHHGSWDRTAAALGVHRNTVRQRIARTAALLGTDLDDPDTRMELWFALRWEPPAGPGASSG